MIKVIHVISDTNVGGAGVLLCNLLACADTERFEIAVVLPRGSLLTPRIRALGFRAIEIDHGADRSSDLRAIPRVCRILRREKPHVLHTHSALYARLAGLFCRVPVSVNTRHCADMDERTSLPFRMAARGAERLFGSHTIATADYVKSILIQKGIPPRNVHVIHNGSCPLPELSEDEKNQVRRELGLSDSDFVVGMVARLELGKGHETLLHAAKICIQKSPHLRFVIVGDGTRAAALHTLAHALDLKDHVIFTGFRKDVARIMAILQVNVNCSERSETSSLSLSEGMSVGVVPVVSRCGGNAYMAGFGQNGVVFPVGNTTALANILLDLERDRVRLAKFSQACRKRFFDCLTAETMTRRTEALYTSLVNKAIAQTKS